MDVTRYPIPMDPFGRIITSVHVMGYTRRYSEAGGDVLQACPLHFPRSCMNMNKVTGRIDVTPGC